MKDHLDDMRAAFGRGPLTPWGETLTAAIQEIECLRKVRDAARVVNDECQGDMTPSLGSMAKLADSLNLDWKRQQNGRLCVVFAYGGEWCRDKCGDSKDCTARPLSWRPTP